MSKRTEITNEQFDRALVKIIEDDYIKPNNARGLLLIPGVYEALSEYFNNDAIELIEKGEVE